MSHEIQQPVRSKDLLCLDCGLDVGECKDDRRGLGSATAKIVVKIWRCLMERMMSCGLEERVCCDVLYTIDSSQIQKTQKILPHSKL